MARHFFHFGTLGLACALEDGIYDGQVKDKWFKDGIDLTKKQVELNPNKKPAKNVILFIGRSFKEISLR